MATLAHKTNLRLSPETPPLRSLSASSASSARCAGAVVIILAAVGLAVALGATKPDDASGERCGGGFVARGPRCFATAAGAGSACPPPLIPSERGCDAPDVRILVPESALTIGPADWEAEGRVRARSIRVGAFRIDAFEVTRGAYAAQDNHAGPLVDGDLARAASGMTPGEAAAFCVSKGGRLPTEDEWIVAAGATPTRRYPWGDTGVVCRRAAWGLEHGPCAEGATGPDTVGAHPSGDTPLGIHDLAGNVAEWVTAIAPPPIGTAAPVALLAPVAPTGAIAKGGSWQSSLASDLRVWARLELPELPGGPRDARVGFRCVYPP